MTRDSMLPSSICLYLNKLAFLQIVMLIPDEPLFEPLLRAGHLSFPGGGRLQWKPLIVDIYPCSVFL